MTLGIWIYLRFRELGLPENQCDDPFADPRSIQLEEGNNGINRNGSQYGKRVLAMDQTERQSQISMAPSYKVRESKAFTSDEKSLPDSYGALSEAGDYGVYRNASRYSKKMTDHVQRQSQISMAPSYKARESKAFTSDQKSLSDSYGSLSEAGDYGIYRNGSRFGKKVTDQQSQINMAPSYKGRESRAFASDEKSLSDSYASLSEAGEYGVYRSASRFGKKVTDQIQRQSQINVAPIHEARESRVFTLSDDNGIPEIAR